MMNDNIILHRRDVERITDVLKKFPNVEMFEINQKGDNGIGTVLTMSFAEKVNDLQSSVTVEISGIESW